MCGICSGINMLFYFIECVVVLLYIDRPTKKRKKEEALHVDDPV